MPLHRNLLVHHLDIIQDFLHRAEVYTLHTTLPQQFLPLNLKLSLNCALLLTELLIGLNLALLNLLSLNVSRPFMIPQ